MKLRRILLILTFGMAFQIQAKNVLHTTDKLSVSNEGPELKAHGDIDEWECYYDLNGHNINQQMNRELEKAVIRAKIIKIHRSDSLFEMTDNAIEDGFNNLIDVYKEFGILVHLIDIENIYNDSLYYFGINGRPFELLQSHSIDSVINFYYLPNIDYTNGSLTGYGQAFDTGNDLFVAGNESVYINNELVNFDLASTFIPIHELGHCLGLLHPHSITGGEEHVIRPDEESISCEVNCSISGDLLCDTEASNSLKNDVIYDGLNCSYDLVETDICDFIYEPQINNFMSYTHFECANAFTADQINTMFNSIEYNDNISNTIIDLGDVNNDSEINVLDILIEINIILSNVNITDLYLWLGDINNDEVINVVDVIQLVNIIINE